MDDALADADAINAAIAITAAITAHIVIDSDTAIDINTVININAASDIDVAISAAATTVRGQAPSSPSHASHICTHAMLAYGDIDLVLSMKAETNINATIAINADADTDVIAINTGSITSPPDAAPRHDSGQSSSGTPVQPARQRRARTCFLRPCPKKYSSDGGKILLPDTAPCLSPHATVL